MNVPEGWLKTDLGYLGMENEAVVQTGPFGAQLHSSDYVDEGIPLILIRNIKQDGLDETNIPRVTKEDAARLSKYTLDKGDIVFSRVGRIGSCFLAEEKHRGWVISGQTLRVRTSGSSVLPRFLIHALNGNYVQRFIKSASVGSTRGSINTSILSNASILLPPLPEQKKIAAILSSVDETIQATRETIEQTKKVKQGLMQELLTRGIGHTKFKKTEIGEIPETWECRKLAELGAILKSHGGSKKDSVESGYPCVRYGELYTTYDTFITNFQHHINEESIHRYTQLQKGDVLLAGSGETHKEIGIAATFLGDEEAYAGGDIIIFRPNHTLNYEFVGHVINSTQVSVQKSRLGQGSSVIHLYSLHVQQLKVPIPPLQEQQEIAGIFTTIDNRIQSEESNLHQLELMKKGLMQDLLTGKVRVAV